VRVASIIAPNRLRWRSFAASQCPGVDDDVHRKRAPLLDAGMIILKPAQLVLARTHTVRSRGGIIMPQGDKSSYTDKQKRQAKHIEEGYEKKGVAPTEAKRRAWATENKVSGGGKKH
jgi:hypothetical protein